MSTFLTIVACVAAYVLIGLGTARAVFTRKYAERYAIWKEACRPNTGSHRNYSSYAGDDPHERTMNDDKVLEPAFLAGTFWPGALPWLLLIKPVGIVLWPLACKWFTAPARKRVAS